MNIVFPANVMGYYKTMIPIVMFDILDDVPFFENIFSNDEEASDNINIRDQVIDLGYDTHNPLLNLRSLSAA